MTKSERRVLGSAADDTAPILHYGTTKFDPDINMGYVQPSWLCIDTKRWRRFGCREMKQIRGKMEFLGKDRWDRCMREYEVGVNSRLLSKKYGMTQNQIARKAREYGIKAHSFNSYADDYTYVWAE